MDYENPGAVHANAKPWLPERQPSDTGGGSATCFISQVLEAYATIAMFCPNDVALLIPQQDLRALMMSVLQSTALEGLLVHCLCFGVSWFAMNLGWDHPLALVSSSLK